MLSFLFRGIVPPAGGTFGGMAITDYEKICYFQNLYNAHTIARRGKRHKADVVAFELDLAGNLWSIKDRLEKKTYSIAGYNHFIIHEPKKREIQALQYGDRIVQHSLCDNVLTPFFENRLIYDNCACRLAKGTHFGMKRLEGFLREHHKQYAGQGWILKVDVHKFFASIDHAALLERLRRIIPDPDVYALLDMIVHSYNADTGKGLPMGNQTSQLFALFYLDPVDRLIKEKLHIKHYTRYMDDMVLIHPDKGYLRHCLNEMRILAHEQLKLEFNEKTHIFPVRQGVDYLGWHFYLTETGKVVKLLRKQNKKKLKRRMAGLQQGYAAGRLNIEDINRSMAASSGHLRHGNTWRLREKIYNQTQFKRTGVEETK